LHEQAGRIWPPGASLLSLGRRYAWRRSRAKMELPQISRRSGRPPDQRLWHARAAASSRADPSRRGRPGQALTAALFAGLQRCAKVVELFLAPLHAAVPALSTLLDRRIDHNRGPRLGLWVSGGRAGIGGAGLGGWPPL